MIKVLVGESNEVFRRGLREILNEQTGMQVSAEAATYSELFSKVRTANVDVVVLELTLPGKEALDALKQLKAEDAHLPIVVIGGRAKDIVLASRVMKAGASAMLSHNAPPQEIVLALRKAIKRDLYLGADVAQNVALNTLVGTPGDERADQLSDRELQVLLMIADGKRLKEIAHELSISYNTVNTYRQRILEKMQMRHNADMIRFAIQNRLIDLQ